jgi:hypothetical protein
MGFCHQCSKGGEIAQKQCFRGALHAFIFGHNVTATAVDQFGQEMFVLLELRRLDIAQGLNRG